MTLSPVIARITLALGLAVALPATAQAAVIYNEIIVKDAAGIILASVTATPAEIAANPSAIYYISGINTDVAQHGNYGTIVDSDANPLEIYGPVDGGPDGNDLGFAFQAIASSIPIQNPTLATGLPIDLTIYLDPALQAVGETASFINTDTSAVPELTTWGMMMAGFAVIGLGVRRRPIRRTAFAAG